ncbi:MAG: sn-glycerol-3-phosphate ABC transporter ATP-binding protein UgpC [Stappiaceae bacterium]
MAEIRLTGVDKRYGDFVALTGLDLHIEDGEFCVFVGPSGCGKSTLLRTIAGLEDLTSGQIRIGDKDVSDAHPGDRGIAMVFQNYALYPHMTARQNMGYSLKLAGKSRAQIEQSVLTAAGVLGLQSLLDRKPSELSGGQRQRVAIGRAIVRDPAAFLFDEPLSNLDAELRARMRLEIAELHQKLGATMIYVTHDQVEAMTLATKIVVLRDGKIEQIGAPLALYDEPANLFVARFIGSPSMNFIPARLQHDEGGAFAVPDLFTQVRIPLESPEGIDAGTPLFIGIRPEHIQWTENGPASIKLRAVESLGDISFGYATLSSGEAFCINLHDERRFSAGDEISFDLSTKKAFIFDARSEKRLQ